MKKKAAGRTRQHPLYVSVIGPHACSAAEHDAGFAIGAGLAKAGAILVCGGLGGLMEAAAKGAKSEGGWTVGILPGDRRSDANDFMDVVLPTGMGPLRNALVARTADAVIAVAGGYGTLSEIAFALRLGIPVVGLHTWTVSRGGEVDAAITVAADPQDAVAKALRLARRAG